MFIVFDLWFIKCNAFLSLRKSAWSKMEIMFDLKTVSIKANRHAAYPLFLSAADVHAQGMEKLD